VGFVDRCDGGRHHPTEGEAHEPDGLLGAGAGVGEELANVPHRLAEAVDGVKDVGASPRHMKDIVLGVVRNGELLRLDAPEADAVELGDKLLVIKTAASED